MIRRLTLTCLMLVSSPYTHPASDPYQPTAILDSLYAQVLQARAERVGNNAGIAIGQLESVVNTHPNYFLARYNLGLAYDDVKRFDDAIAQLQAAKQLNEKLSLGDPTIDNSLASVYLSVHRYQEASMELDAASAPENIRKLAPAARQVVFNNRGLAYSGLNQSCEAALAYDLATNAVQSTSAPITTNGLSGTWIVMKWAQRKPALKRDLDKTIVTGWLTIAPERSSGSQQGDASLCVKSVDRIVAYSVRERLSIVRSDNIIRIDGRVSAGALKWDDDHVTATRNGNTLTGTLQNADKDTYDVAAERVW